jgi:hypothetical protein
VYFLEADRTDIEKNNRITPYDCKCVGKVELAELDSIDASAKR